MIDIGKITSLMDGGATVVTVNDRLSKYLSREYESYKIGSGASAWSTPAVLPIGVWLKGIYNSRCEGPVLISPSQSLHLWERVIEEDDRVREAGVRRIFEMAPLAAEAYSNLLRYGIDLDGGSSYLTEEVRLFMGWIRRYEAILKREGCMDPLALYSLLGGWIDNGTLRVAEILGSTGKGVVFAGFDDPSPADRTIFDKVGALGIEVTMWPEEEPPVTELSEGARPRVELRTYEDGLSEVVQCARWIRSVWSDSLKVGVVVPDLGSYKRDLVREFAFELNSPSIVPWSTLVGGLEGGSGEDGSVGGVGGTVKKDIFNISLGTSLMDEPVVASAMEFLSVRSKDGGQREGEAKGRSSYRPGDGQGDGQGDGRIGLDDLSSLLLSPYMARNREERIILAALESALRGGGSSLIDERSLQYHIDKINSASSAADTAGDASGSTPDRGAESKAHSRFGEAPPPEVLQEATPEALIPKDLSTRLLKVFSLTGSTGGAGYKRATRREWVEIFIDDLDSLGWPGGEVLTSDEVQAKEAFIEGLSTYSTFDNLSEAVTRGRALREVRGYLERTIFQPKREESSIQVLGLLEAAGHRFDKLWIMGAHDGVLPGEASANPFLPIPLQRIRGVPGASPAIMHAYAEKVVRRLLGSSPHVIVSAPLESGREGGRPRRPSPLFSAFGNFMDGEVIDESSSYKEALFKEGESGSPGCDGDKELPVEELPLEVALPFLNGELDSIEGGTSILKEFSDCPFKAFGVRRLGAGKVEVVEPGLNPMEKGTLLHGVLNIFWGKVKSHGDLLELERRGDLKGVIRWAVDEGLKDMKGPSVKGHYRNLERSRLEELLTEWLGKEGERGPFTVSERESKRVLTVGSLNMRMTLDRVDSIPGSGRLLIDYKTGLTTTSKWKGERPEEPQMLAYSMTGDYDGFAFGEVRRGTSALKGCCTSEEAAEAIGGGLKAPKGEDFEEMVEGWSRVVASLAGGFTGGDVRVEPRELHGASGKGGSPFDRGSTCGYCHLQPLCRIYEVVSSAGGADYEGGGEDGD